MAQSAMYPKPANHINRIAEARMVSPNIVGYGLAIASLNKSAAS
jgi:hypothetical protein